MKYLLIFSVFLFCANIVLAGDISQIIFTNDPRIVKPNEVALVTIQIQYAGDSHPTSCMEMFTDSTTGQFSSSETNWNTVDKLTINSNWTNKNFYYKDSTVGNYTLAIKVIPVSCSTLTNQEAQWTITQNIIISEQQTEQPQTPSQPESTTVVDSSASWPVEPQIFANAGKDQTAIAGADVYFSGQALGLQKEPLENARYLWNFGDGAIAEGQNTKHVYKYPGEYIVVLDVSSGKYSASDRSMAKIIPNQLEIIEANQNYIKLHNGSNVELDISSWFLRAENSLFKFPANTFIKTNRDLMIDSSISGLKAENQKAEILYPNSSAAFSYSGPIVTNSTNSTTVVESESQKIEEKPKESQIEELSTSTTQVANIISTTEPNSFGLKKWLTIILGMSVFFAGGFIFIRRQSSL